MAKHAMIYEKPAPLSKERHASWSVTQGENYSFCKGLNAVPLTLVEFAAASREYPIVFAKSGDEYIASALLGLRDKENLFVDAHGKWIGGYVPAFLRRYPFVFAHDADAGKYTLCIDEGGALAGEQTEGNRLFDDDGKETPYLGRMMSFTKRWQKAYQDTQEFCQRLAELLLIVDSEIPFKLPTGERAKVSGFAAVDREVLKSLKPETVSSLLKTGDLEHVFEHLLSHRSLDSLHQHLPDEPSLLH